jgi:hypothetical protein
MGGLNSAVIRSDQGITETIYISFWDGREELIFTIYKN